MTKTLAAMVVALLTPSVSGAAICTWKNSTSGSWTEKANWSCTGGTLVPNSPGDQVFFTNPYTAAFQVIVPKDTTITIGQIFSAAPHEIAIRPENFNSLLILDHGAGTPLVRTFGGSNTLRIEVPMDMRQDLTIEVLAGTQFFKTIGRLGILRGITKRGENLAWFTAVNNYTGPTIVEEGALYLQSPLFNTIKGEATVGGTARQAYLVVDAPDQISDLDPVVVKANGHLTALHSERLTARVEEGGRVVVGSNVTQARLTFAGLQMAGGSVETQLDGQIVLDGPVIATSTASSPAVIGVQTGRPLDLGALPRTITVTDGPRDVDVVVLSHIVGAASAGIIKDGPGTLRLQATQSSAYPGTTRVEGGRVELGNASGRTAVPGVSRSAARASPRASSSCRASGTTSPIRPTW